MPLMSLDSPKKDMCTQDPGVWARWKGLLTAQVEQLWAGSQIGLLAT